MHLLAEAHDVPLAAPYAEHFRVRLVRSPASSQEVRQVTVSRLARDGRGFQCSSMEQARSWMAQQLAAAPAQQLPAAPAQQQAPQEAPFGGGASPVEQCLPTRLQPDSKPRGLLVHPGCMHVLLGPHSCQEA